MTLRSCLRVVFSSLVASFCLNALGESNVAWKLHPKAVSYNYIISTDELFLNPIIEAKTNFPKTKDLNDLSPGVYFIKVKFIDRWDRESRFSPASSFEVIKGEDINVTSAPFKWKLKSNINAKLAFIPSLSIKFKGKDFSRKNFIDTSFTKLFTKSSHRFLGSVGGLMSSSHDSRIIYSYLDIEKDINPEKIVIGLRSTLQYIKILEASKTEKLDISGMLLTIGPTLSIKSDFCCRVDSHFGIDKDFSHHMNLNIIFPEKRLNYFSLSPGLGYTRTEIFGSDGRLEVDSINFLIILKEANDHISER
jgi:hypothetical protein